MHSISRARAKLGLLSVESTLKYVLKSRLVV